MEALKGKAKYLIVKVKTQEPVLWEKRLEKIGAKFCAYDKDQKILSLAFDIVEINELLKKLLDTFPQLDIVETSLQKNLSLQGYRKVFSSDISIVSPGLGFEPQEGEIIIKSNLSFGSGYHPSTELAIRLLSDAFKRRSIEKVFDLGTGSGILALCAAKLGAKDILAVDIDYRACQEAWKNISLNQKQDIIKVVCGSLESVKTKIFDLLLANLTIGTITWLAPHFSSLLKEGGLAILSGFTQGQVQEVNNSLGNPKVLKQDSLEGWAGLLVSF